MGYSLRLNQKQISTSSHPQRNLHFEYLAELRNRFQRRICPSSAWTARNANSSVISKTLAVVGNPPHAMSMITTSAPIPLGSPFLMGFTMSRKIAGLWWSVFPTTPPAHWWHQQGFTRYRGSRQLLILADTGGSNGCRCYAWKTELQWQLANSFPLAVTVAHYPTGASKWNPIEHRLFFEVSRNWAGEPLDSYQKILNYARTTTTHTGLQVTAYLDRRYYPCGVKPTPDQIAALQLEHHQTLPEWNYTIYNQRLCLRRSKTGLLHGGHQHGAFGRSCSLALYSRLRQVRLADAVGCGFPFTRTASIGFPGYLQRWRYS
jgi:hypothetical protein